MTGPQSFRASPDDHGERLDVVLARRVPGLSRSQASVLIRDGRVHLNGRAAGRGAAEVRGDDEISVDIPLPEPTSAVAQNIGLDILYEDADLIVVNKPAGLVVHPAHGHADGTLVNALLGHAATLAPSDDPMRPGIVHRIDKDTSGCLVVAKTVVAREGLLAQFRSREVGKTYLAVVHGRPPREGTIDASIGRDPVNRKKMSVRSRAGRAASSRWQLRESFVGASLLEVEILTGRTHQIRVHLASLGFPLLGDRLYGGDRRGAGQAAKSFARQALHAARLRFRHPRNGQTLDLEAPLPADLEELIARLRGSAGKQSRA